MLEQNGMPKLGTSATTLGIRKGKDIDVDSANMVHQPAFLPGEKNGLSCSATIASLPPFALPVEWGGSNRNSVVWSIDAEDLPSTLRAVDDSLPGKNRHISIGPSGSMLYDEFARAIEETRPKWKRVTKP